VAFSPQANYTDGVAATCRRSKCRFLHIEECRVVSATGPQVVNIDVLDRSRYFSAKYLLRYPHEAEWTPFQTHYFS
jgi:hypothetical protein